MRRNADDWLCRNENPACIISDQGEAVMAHRLYTDLAAWWPLFQLPGYYEGEALSVMRALDSECAKPPRNILELGSGGGSMAFHLRDYSRLTLVEPATSMLAISRCQNPAAEHVQGDMRSLRLGRIFDAVIIHDAINYMTHLDDLIAALVTARHHLAPGGVVMVMPDDTEESFRPTANVGGMDEPDQSRGLRYLCWTHSPKGATYVVDFAIMLRSQSGSVEVIHDRHKFGLFSCATWRLAFDKAGLSFPTVRGDRWRQHVFLARASGGTACCRRGLEPVVPQRTGYDQKSQ